MKALSLLVALSLLAAAACGDEPGDRPPASDACHGIEVSDVEQAFAHHATAWTEATIDGGCEWRPDGATHPRVSVYVSDESSTSSSGTSLGASYQYPEGRHLHLSVAFGQVQMAPEEFAAEEAAFRRFEQLVELPAP